MFMMRMGFVRHAGIRPERLLNTMAFYDEFQSTFASPNSSFPCGYRRLRSVRREELRPELLEAPCAPAWIALSLC